jgi:hypothetical protein
MFTFNDSFLFIYYSGDLEHAPTVDTVWAWSVFSVGCWTVTTSAKSACILVSWSAASHKVMFITLW